MKITEIFLKNKGCFLERILFAEQEELLGLEIKIFVEI